MNNNNAFSGLHFSAPHLKKRDRERATPSKDQIANASQPQPSSQISTITPGKPSASTPAADRPAQSCVDRVQGTPSTGPAKRVMTPALSTPHMDSVLSMPASRTKNVGVALRVGEPLLHTGPPARTTPSRLAAPMVDRVITPHDKQNGCHPGRVENQTAIVTSGMNNVAVAGQSFRNLNLTSDDFSVEGVAPLKSPPMSAVPTHNASSSSAALDSSVNPAGSGEGDLNKTFPVEGGVTETKQPVARTISFDDRGQALGGSGGLKFSPATGRCIGFVTVFEPPAAAGGYLWCN